MRNACASSCLLARMPLVSRDETQGVLRGGIRGEGDGAVDGLDETELVKGSVLKTLAMTMGELDFDTLFDLINDCAGYTEKYYEEIGAGKLSYKQMVKKYRKERDNSVDWSDESVLLGDNHPHCLMVLEGIHKLFRMFRSQSKDQLSVDYLDTLILRLNVSP